MEGNAQCQHKSVTSAVIAGPRKEEAKTGPWVGWTYWTVRVTCTQCGKSWEGEVCPAA